MKRWVTQNWFLLGLAGSVALAFTWPTPGAPGGAFRPEATTKMAVALVFFVQGLILALEALYAGLRSWRLHVLVQSFTYLIIPLLALALNAVLGQWLPPDLRLGFLFLAVLPTTISSAAVFTALSGGNTAAALVNATLSSLLGVVLTPVWVNALLEVRGEALPLWPLVRELILLVLVPLVLGQLARRWWRDEADRGLMRLSHLNSLLVLYIVYAAFCASVQSGVWTQHGWRPAGFALGGVVILFSLVLLLTLLAVRIFRLAPGDRIAALFCAPQKTLATGAPMAKLIFAAHPALGLILLPVMFYHPLQLLVSGAMVNMLRPRTDGETNIAISS